MMYRIALGLVSLALVLAIIAVINRHFRPVTRTLQSTPAIGDTITFEDNRFIPTFTTVRSGESVIFKNNSATPLTISIDANWSTEPNTLIIGPNSFQALTATNLGVFTFYNQEHPAIKAQVSVE